VSAVDFNKKSIFETQDRFRPSCILNCCIPSSKEYLERLCGSQHKSSFAIYYLVPGRKIIRNPAFSSSNLLSGRHLLVLLQLIVDLLLSDLQSGGFLSIKMDAIQTHPSNAAQAKAFTAPGSLSFPGAAGELTPPSMGNDKNQAMNGGQMQGGQATNGNGVTPATPAATPAATQSSGLVPTLQNIVATVNLDCRLDLKTIALHARNAEYNPKVLLAV
jgi:hypothetical protein